jgi:hypothetical protein
VCVCWPGGGGAFFVFSARGGGYFFITYPGGGHIFGDTFSNHIPRSPPEINSDRSLITDVSCCDQIYNKSVANHIVKEVISLVVYVYECNNYALNCIPMNNVHMRQYLQTYNI